MRKLKLLGLVAFSWVNLFAQSGNYSEREEMYRRFLDFPKYVIGGNVEPHWMADGNSFWYAEGAPENTVIWKVDPVANTKEPLFDTGRLRRSLAEVLGQDPPGIGVPFEVFEYQEQEEAVRFEIEGRRFVLRLDDYELRDMEPPTAEEIDFKTPRTWKCQFGATHREVVSSDGKWFAGIDNYNFYVRSSSDGRKMGTSSDGSRDDQYVVDGEFTGEFGRWSPDNLYLPIVKIDYRGVPTIPIAHYLEAVEEVDWLTYPRSGQTWPKTQLYIVNTESFEKVKAAVDPAVGYLEVLDWQPDSSEVYLSVMSRYMDPAKMDLQILGVNPRNGSSRVILQSKVRGRFTLLSGSDRFLWVPRDEQEQKLYLYDLGGNLLRQLTPGKHWITQVVTVDEDSRWVYYLARADSERPFDEHLYRVPLNGGDPEQLTQEPGLHRIQFLPSKQYFLDTHSSVRRPPRVELRRQDGQAVRTLSEADVSRLQELNWTPGEEFVVKDSREEGEIHGILFKPTNFDPSLKYPLVQFIYPSNRILFQRSFVPGGMNLKAQAFAQLGFVTLVLGVSNRALFTSEFEERGFAKAETADSASAIRQLAAERRYMDTDRVGIYGSSKGGFYSILAILEAPEIYDVAVSVAGITDMAAHIGNHPFLGPPGTNSEAFEGSSVIHLADRLEGKLLLIHGTGDTAVPISHTMRLADALIRANKHFDMLIMPEETHMTRNIWDRYGLDAAMRYFVEHLKP